MIHIFNRVNSKLSTIMVGFDAGSRLEQQYGFLDGTAHMLEHCIFKGTSKRNCSDISRQIGFLGGFTNAFTSHEMVGYYITVPYENLEPALEILSDIVLNSTIPEDEFLKEREVVKEEEISRLDDVDSYMWNHLSKSFFSNYISRPVIGTQDTISQFTRDSTYSFYRNFCKREKMVVSLSGNHTKRYAKRLMSKYFGREDSSNIFNFSKEPCVYTENHEGSLISKPGIEHSYMWISYPGSPRGSALESATKVMSCILGSGMDSRLFSEVREKNGLVYSIYSSHSQWDCGSLFSIESSTRSANIDNSLELIDKEVSKMKTSLVTDEELDRAKNKIRASFYSTLESSYGMASYSLRRKLFGLSSIEDLIDSLTSVTKNDVIESANNVFNDQLKYSLVCSPPAI